MNELNDGRATRRRRVAQYLSAAAVSVAIVSAIPQVRTPILRSAGWTLVLDEPTEVADAIVVIGSGDRSTLLDAADLVRAGVSNRVAVLADPPGDADRELVRRGISFDDEADVAIHLLHRLGVPEVEMIVKPVAGTAGIGRVLPMWCDRQRHRAVVIVTPPDHSKRTRRVLDRAMKGYSTRVRIRAARYSHFDPDRWWHSRDGVRTTIVELQKLLVDFARHPV